MAENYTQVNSYQDKLLEAMQIVSSQLISAIPYDKTVTCTIINDEEKEKGKYKVTNSDATFDAFSSDTTLKKDDVVYVTIPEGNYDNQKIIQGKKTSDSEKPFVFTTPFDTMLDLTDNLIVNQDTKNGLIANNGYMTKTVIEEQKPIEVISKEQGFYKEICSLHNLNLAGYTRLGIKANFMSWIPEAVKGSYGLRITITDNLNTTTTDDHLVTSVQQTKVMLLDTQDMYGSPYNFESYYSQEKVFPITELNTITDIKIEFYQIAGSFYDINNNILSLQDSQITELDGIKTYSTNYGENLFVDNVYISVGYDVSEITDELIVPVINDSMTYSSYRENELNKKEIDLRWVHQFEDGPKVVEPREDFELSTARLKDCEIRWYRYKLGAAAADEYSGVYWTGLSVTKDNDKYILSEWDGQTALVDKTDIAGTVICDEDGNAIKIEKPVYGETQALTNVIFTPNTDYQTEQIKTIIFLDGVAIRGPVITFKNEQTTTGKEATDFINALEVECVDGTLGNYLLYNEAGNILNTADSSLERKLQCNFAEEGSIAKSNLLLDVEKGDTITWKFPINNTMVSLLRCGSSNIDQFVQVNISEEDYVYGKYYIKQNEHYIVTNEEYSATENYYEKQLISDVINLKDVWIQVNEYSEEDKTGFELRPVFNEDQETIKYYSLYKNNIEYYRNNEVLLGADNEPIAPYYKPYYEPWNVYKDINQNYIILQGDRTLNYNQDTHITSILYPTYKISALYSMYNMNNTIACTIRKNRVVYTTEKEFTFGVSGTMGSDKSLVIDFVGGHTAIIANDTTTSYQLEVKMYDENNKPEDLTGVPISWTWFTPGNSPVSKDLTITPTAENPAVATLTNKGLDLNDKENIYIAQVNVGEEGAELTTYFPIPIKLSEEYSHIEGATSVIYLSNGEPEYYKGDYKLYETIDDTIGSPVVELSKHKVSWGVITQETKADFKAEINVTKKDGVITAYKGLKPINVYTEGLKNYAVIAKIGTTTVWQQPILVIRNKYPSRVINKWDGKTLTIDDANGTILATSMAAGRKDGNAFTGVMLGDWTGDVVDGSLRNATGVYGFHQGDMSYAFMDNGKAFIGKNGAGRIEFDCSKNEAIISNPNNMSINLTSGQINANNFSLHAKANDEQYVVLQTSTTGNGSLNGNLSTGTLPFEIGKNFNVSWAGHVTAKSGDIGCWQLEQVVENADGTSTSGGRLIAKNVTGSQSSYWDKIYLDPVTNTISGGKLKASIFESTSTKPIKLGGAIDVYDPSKLVTITNPHTGNSESQVNYNTTSGGTNQAILGGTLGFMPMSGGADVPADFQPAGIGFKAAGTGAEVKATNQNVGMNIGRNYLFLSNYTNSSGKAISEFQVVVHGQSTQVEYTKTGTDADGNDIYKTEEKQINANSSMIFNGNGLAVKSGGGNGGRVILEEGSHAGIGYGDSYVALYRSEAQLVGATQVKIGTKYGKDLLVGKTSTLDIGTEISKITIGRENAGTGDSTAYGTTTLLKGSKIDLNAATINLTGTTKVTGAATITGLLTGQLGAKISGATASLEGASGVKGLIVKNGYDLYGAGTINGNLTRASGNLNWKGGTIDFDGATQVGIKAQFA